MDFSYGNTIEVYVKYATSCLPLIITPTGLASKYGVAPTGGALELGEQL
jgi:hypothetical protein